MVDEPIPYCQLGVSFAAVTVFTSIRTHSPCLSVFSLRFSSCLLFLFVIALHIWRMTHKADSLSVQSPSITINHHQSPSITINPIHNVYL